MIRRLKRACQVVVSLKATDLAPRRYKFFFFLDANVLGRPQEDRKGEKGVYMRLTRLERGNVDNK